MVMPSGLRPLNCRNGGLDAHVEVLNPLARKTSQACTAGGSPTPPSYVTPV